MRRALEYVGRRPIVTLWLGLQFNLYLYWRASEAHRLLDRISDGFGILGAMSLLNTQACGLSFHWLRSSKFSSRPGRGDQSLSRASSLSWSCGSSRPLSHTCSGRLWLFHAFGGS
jgi:hypothetical protein